MTSAMEGPRTAGTVAAPDAFDLPHHSAPAAASQIESGQEAKRKALCELEIRRERIILRARRAFLEYLLKHGCGTVEQVRPAVMLPPGVNPVCLGAVPAGLIRPGIITRDGYVPTARTEAHARPVSLWRLVDPAAARAWLETHPDTPDEDPGCGAAGEQRELWEVPCPS